jgi:hypothetical protein
MPRRAISHPLAVLLGAVCVATFHAQTRPQQPDPAATTMGSLLLQRSADGAAALPAIDAALTHDESGLRAVAARLVDVGRLLPLRARLIAALSAERNEAVAAEQVRALMRLGAVDTVGAVEAHLVTARRTGSRGVRARSGPYEARSADRAVAAAG